MHKLLLLISFCFLSFVSNAQVNFLDDKDWEEAKILASQSGKPIFIDFYTTWCSPCKIMDKMTFSDSIVAGILNDQFICLKLDADKEINKDVVKQFEVNTYPTFVFADTHGDLISVEKGVINKNEFADVCQGIISFLNDGLSKRIKVENIDNLSAEDLEKVYTVYANINFDAKSEIKSRCYEKVERGEEISINAFDFLLANYELGDRYHLLIDLIPKGKFMRDHIQMIRRFERIFEFSFKEATLKNDLEEFIAAAKNYEKVYWKTNRENFPSGLKEPSKELRVKRLSFYLENKRYDEYVQIADSLITEYILPISVERIRVVDEFMANSLRQSKSMSEDETSKEPMEPNSPSLRKELVTKNSESLKLSKRLSEIAENIVKGTDHKEKLEKALTWVELAISYIDLPESRILKAAILTKLGNDKESKAELEFAKSSPYFDRSCEKKMKELLQN